MKKILLLLVFGFITATLCSQNISGHLTAKEDGEVQAASFVHVILYKQSDTTAIYKAAVSDIDGYYMIESVPSGDYCLITSSLEYEEYKENLSVEEAQGNITKNIILNLSSLTLDDIEVVGYLTKQNVDNTSYIISKKDLKGTVSSLDLVKNIPKLSVNPITKTISDPMGGSVKILINGANATELDLRAIDSDQIESIIHYDLPPARFSGYTNVINFITKPIKRGYNLGVDVGQEVRGTMGDYNYYFNYNWDKNQIGINGDISYRDFTNNFTSDGYVYNINGVDYSRYSSANGKLGYITNNMNLKYIRNVENKYFLQVNLSPNFQYMQTSNISEITQYIGDSIEERSGSNIDNSNNFAPSLDIYSAIKLAENQELIVNVVGTYNHANQDIYTSEYLIGEDDTAILEDKDYLTNNKKSIIGEVQYANNFKIGTLSVGSNVNYGTLKSDVEELTTTSTYTTNVFSNYSWAEFGGSYKKLMYRATAALMYYKNTSNENSYQSLLFLPKLVLGYQFSDKISARLIYNRNTYEPSLSQLSSNSVVIIEGISREGNPYLENSTSDVAKLNIDIRNSWLNLSIEGKYVYEDSPINSYFVEADDYISLKYENADSKQEVAATAYVNISPFKNNLLTLQLSGGVQHNIINGSQIGNYSYTSFPFNYTLMFYYKDFLLGYNGNIPTKYLDGPYLNGQEPKSELYLQYQYKNFSFTAVCASFLTNTTYDTEMIGNSIVNYNKTYTLGDIKNTVILGVSYRFGSGKKYNEGNKKINNRDSDAGIFRD
ncbi:MAG: outer membrane beta-barrel protein [bacterium]